MEKYKKSFITIIAYISIMLLLGVVVISNILIILSHYNLFLASSNNQLQDYMRNSYDSYISTILSIFAIISSVWIGMNIITFIEKKDIESLNEKLKEQEFLTKQSKENIQSYNQAFVSYILSQNIKNSNCSELLDEIFNHNFYQYLSFNPDFLNDIMYIENQLSRVNDSNKQIMNKSAKIGVNYCEKKMNFYTDSSKSVPSELRYYLYLRNADFYYYLAESRWSIREIDYKKESKDIFLKSLDFYQKCLELSFNSNNYIKNSIAFIYFRLFLIEKKSSNYRLAKDYFEKINRSEIKKPDYFWYYGVFLEKGEGYDRLLKINQALEQYENAIECDINHFPTLYNYASALLKKVLLENNIDRRMDLLSSLGNLDKKTKNYMYNEMIKIERLLNYAMNIKPLEYVIYMKLGELYTYMMLFGDNQKNYEDLALYNLNMAKIANPKVIKINAHIRNFYEAKNDLSIAKKINHELIQFNYKDAEIWEEKLKKLDK